MTILLLRKKSKILSNVYHQKYFKKWLWVWVKHSKVTNDYMKYHLSWDIKVYVDTGFTKSLI